MCIDKPVHVYSVEGAAATVILAPASATASGFAATVAVLSDGADFGAINYGFTLTGGNSFGVAVDIPAQSDSLGVTVKGNVDVADKVGFTYLGREYLPRCPPGYCIRSARILIASNQAIGNVVGFELVANTDYSGSIIARDNRASGAGTGFAIIPGFQGGYGEVVNGAGNLELVNNVASGNAIGFYADTAGRVDENTASGNAQSGFLIFGNVGSFEKNSAIGNAGPGVVINFSPDFFTAQSYLPFTALGSNNFFGNDRQRPPLSFSATNYFDPWSSYQAGPSAHCGVLNLGALTPVLDPQDVPPATNLTLQLVNDYWGAAKGASASGAGDAVGGACDQNGAVTQVRSFSPTPLASTVLAN